MGSVPSVALAGLALPLRFVLVYVICSFFPPQTKNTKNNLFENSVSGCSIASQGRFFPLEKQLLFILDITFRVNVAKPLCPLIKYLSELIPGIRGIRGNATNRAGPDLCSTRSVGKDDGS